MKSLLKRLMYYDKYGGMIVYTIHKCMSRLIDSKKIES